MAGEGTQPALAIMSLSWFSVSPDDIIGPLERDMLRERSSVLVIMSTLSSPAIPAKKHTNEQTFKKQVNVCFVTPLTAQ